ncbi:30S ribosomal protein S17 [soil metagenome]
MSELTKQTKTLTGRVISNKMDKTVVVLIERKVPHPKYGKFVKRLTKIFAHDENNQYNEGDFIVIKETRPRSKKKSWEVVEAVEQA